MDQPPLLDSPPPLIKVLMMKVGVSVTLKFWQLTLKVTVVLIVQLILASNMMNGITQKVPICVVMIVDVMV